MPLAHLSSTLIIHLLIPTWRQNNLFPLLPSVGGAGQTCSSPLAQGGVGRGSGSPRRFSSPTIASAPKPAGSQRWPTPTAMRPEDILIRGASNSNSPNVGPAAAAGDDKRVAHPSSPSSSSAGGAKYVNGSGSWRGRSFGTVHINDPRPQVTRHSRPNQTSTDEILAKIDGKGIMTRS
jgi:hypothetical protein